jgi:hypothetical protein
MIVSARADNGSEMRGAAEQGNAMPARVVGVHDES